MMSLGSFGGGGPSSSPPSSNLSALAPPFTVDRSNSKPSASPLLQFSESPYATGFSHTWQYANPAASGLDAYQKSELEADSTNITPMSSANDYHFRYSVSESNNTPSNCWSTLNSTAKTSTDPFLYDSEVGTYYPPYVSPVADEGTPLVALSDPSYDVLPSSGLVSANASSQVDYTQSLSGLEYTPSWGGICYGLVDTKRGKHAELDGSFIKDKSNASDSVAFTNYLNPGCNLAECESIQPEDCGSSCRQFSNVIGRESSKHLVRMEHADNKSFLAQNIRSLPFDSVTSISSPCFTISESLPTGPCLQSSKNSSNYQNSYNSYGKGNQPINSCFNPPVATTKSSPTLVIRPPSVGTGLALQKSTSRKRVDIVDAASVHLNEGLGNKSLCRGKEPQVLQNSEGQEGSFFTRKLKNHKDETNKLFSLPSSVEEGPPSKVQNKDALSPFLWMNAGSQFPNVNTLDGSSFSGESVLGIKSSENFADGLDNHNPAVDSPCWKGAPSSHFTIFDAAETDSSHPFKKKTDECHHMDLQVNATFLPLRDPFRSPSEKMGQDKVHHEHGSAATEHVSVDMTKIIPSLTSNEGVQVCEESSKAGEEYNPLNNSNRDSRMKFFGNKQLGIEGSNFAIRKTDLEDAAVETVMTVNDISEGGAVAVRAAENVLCSPSSEESASEQVKSHKSAATPQMDVRTLINTMQNLSDLLVFCCSSDKCALKEQEHEALKHVISSLDSLLSQGMEYMTRQEESILAQVVNSEKDVEHLQSPKCVGAGKCQFENKAHLKFHGQVDHPECSEEKKAVTCLHFPSLSNDLDCLGDDNISKAIRKVLDENSYFGEEEHSQAHLFKSLWLEAEAKLCSISYRARFDRMKFEMEILKSKQLKDVTENVSEKAHAPNTAIFSPLDVENSLIPSNADAVENSFKARLRMLNCRGDPKPFNLVPQQQADDVENSLTPSNADAVEDSVKARLHVLNCRVDPGPFNSVPKQQADDVENSLTPSNADAVEDSVKARLHVLNCRGDQKPLNLVPQQQADDVEASVMTRFHILKCRDDSNPITPVGQQVDMFPAVHSGKLGRVRDQSVDLVGTGYESVKDFILSVTDDSVSQSPGKSGKRNQFSAGSTDNSSSDWEHVLKEDFSWR